MKTNDKRFPPNGRKIQGPPGPDAVPGLGTVPVKPPQKPKPVPPVEPKFIEKPKVEELDGSGADKTVEGSK